MFPISAAAGAPPAARWRDGGGEGEEEEEGKGGLDPDETFTASSQLSRSGASGSGRASVGPTAVGPADFLFWADSQPKLLIRQIEQSVSPDRQF